MSLWSHAAIAAVLSVGLASSSGRANASANEAAAGGAVDEPKSQAARPARLTLGLMGGAALGVGTPLWAGGDLKLERRFWRKGVVGGRLKLTLGNDDEGRPLGGYRLNVFGGFDWFKSRFVSWKWLVHVGTLSVVWIPTPNVGLDSELSVSPLVFDHFRWTLGWDGTMEFPWRGATSVWTELAVPFDAFSIGIRGSIGAHGGIDLIGVGMGGSLQLAWLF